MSKNKRCVFVADTQASAIGVSHWLRNLGIENVLVDKTTLGISNGVSFFSDDPSGDGWQIWVNDLEDVEQAHQMLEERERKKESQREQGSIESTCEACGTTSEFGGKDRGTVQSCPKCGRYMDVEGGLDEFEWPDSFDVN